MSARTLGDLHLLRALAREARPLARHLLALLLLGLLAAPLALLLPLPVAVVADGVLGSGHLPPALGRVLPASWRADPEALLLGAVAALVLLATLLRAQRVLSALYETWIGERLVLGLRARLFEHLTRLSAGFHDRRDAADALHRVQVDATGIRDACVHGVVPLAASLVRIAALGFVAAQVDLVLAGVALAAAPVLLLLLELHRRTLRRRWRAARESESATLSVVQESLGALPTMQAFGAEARTGEQFRRRARAHADTTLAAARTQAGFDLWVGAATALGAGAVLYAGALHVQAGLLSPGELLLVVAWLAQVLNPLREFGSRLADLQRSLASSARVFEVLDAVPEPPEAATPEPLARAVGALGLHGVGFAYEPGRPVLQDVSVSIPAGCRVALSGRTGAGKSTLLALLLRLQDPREGRVTLDGVDLRALRLADLRRQIAWVPSEPRLFSASVAENIAYGRPDARPEAIVAAATSARAHDFITRLPQGYATRLGGGGARLSAGERQRIALARALVREAPILLLDEPTSALDRETRAAVVRALGRDTPGRTVLVATHRPEELGPFDLHLELRAGRLHVRGEGLSADRPATAGGVASPG